MAIGKRRTRPLVVGDRRFRWRADFHDPWLSMGEETRNVPARHRLFVRPEDAPNNLLTVIVSNSHVLTPGLVRAYIDKALLQGWLSTRATLIIES